MATDQLVERRLTALEQAVADLRKRLPEQAERPDWVRQIIGSVSDSEAFAEALEHGRAFRQADRPTDEPERVE